MPDGVRLLPQPKKTDQATRDRWLLHQALLIAHQLPEDEEEARIVLRIAKELNRFPVQPIRQKPASCA